MDNVKYRDPHFDLTVMTDYCLNGLRKQENEEDDDESRPAEVKRVGDIYEKPQFIVDGMDTGDIQQGAVGDCWFLAAVAAIANMATLLESICVARDEAVGVYGFIVFRDGEWISEVIDDQLFINYPDYADAGNLQHAFAKKEDYVNAVQRGSNALYFASCADSNETWLPLLEKAFTKAHGDYSAIHLGVTGEAVEDLTGGVTTEIICNDIMDHDRLWKEDLLTVNEELVFAGQISGIQAEDVKGIFTNHAYSVLKTVERNGKRMVKVRNPWGKKEWKGAWSDGSSEWTPEAMTLLDHKFGDDSAF